MCKNVNEAASGRRLGLVSAVKGNWDVESESGQGLCAKALLLFRRLKTSPESCAEIDRTSPFYGPTELPERWIHFWVTQTHNEMQS